MTQSINRRAFDRFSLPPMHSFVRVSRQDEKDGEGLIGHAYDVSESGVRVELDEALAPGEAICLSISLPGEQTGINARGEVVWTSDPEDDPGPRRVGVRFEQFETPFASKHGQALKQAPDRRKPP